MKTFLTLLLLWPVLVLGKTNAPQASYTNPVRTSDGAVVRVADPFVFRHEGTYYMIGTTRQHNGFDCYTSPDLVNWTFTSAAYTKPEGHFGVSAFWAPEVCAYGGKFYLTYSACNSSRRLLSALAVSDRPEGPYTDLHAPWFDFGYNAIDCHIFVDHHQSPYLYFSKNASRPGFSSGENYVIPLSRDLSKLIGEPRLVGEASQAWELWDWTRNRGNEGVFVFAHRGKYYLTYSANNTTGPHYGVGYAVANHPLGPWIKGDENPILTSDIQRGVSSPGHNSVVWSPDSSERFIVYHRHADPTKPSYDRIVCIDRLVVKGGKLRVVGPTTTPQPMPSAKAKAHKILTP